MLVKYTFVLKVECLIDNHCLEPDDDAEHVAREGALQQMFDECDPNEIAKDLELVNVEVIEND